jgi:hypothetical protein
MDNDEFLESLRQSHEPIDQRLVALIESLQSSHREREKWEAKMRRLDARERKGREAILSGFEECFRIMRLPESGPKRKPDGS